LELTQSAEQSFPWIHRKAISPRQCLELDLRHYRGQKADDADSFSDARDEPPSVFTGLLELNSPALVELSASRGECNTEIGGFRQAVVHFQLLALPQRRL